jgi:hypothetical protein
VLHNQISCYSKSRYLRLLQNIRADKARKHNDFRYICIMRFILYFIFFYILFRIVHSLVRRALYGPRKRRSFYVNWGSAGGNTAGGAAQGAGRPATAQSDNGEPMVGGRPSSQKNVAASRELSDIQEAEFIEVSDTTEKEKS